MALPADAASTAVAHTHSTALTQTRAPADSDGPEAVKPELPPIPEGGKPEQYLSRRYHPERRYCFKASLRWRSGMQTLPDFEGVAVYDSPWSITWWWKFNRGKQYVPGQHTWKPVFYTWKYRTTVRGRMRVLVGSRNGILEDGMRNALAFLDKGELRRLKVQGPTHPTDSRDRRWHYLTTSVMKHASGAAETLRLSYFEDPATERVVEFVHTTGVSDERPWGRSNTHLLFHDEAELRPGQKCPFELPEPFRKPMPSGTPDASAPSEAQDAG